jgi:hypothetical protein
MNNSYLKQKLAANDGMDDNERFFSRPLYPIEKIQ